MLTLLFSYIIHLRINTVSICLSMLITSSNCFPLCSNNFVQLSKCLSLPLSYILKHTNLPRPRGYASLVMTQLQVRVSNLQQYLCPNECSFLMNSISPLSSGHSFSLSLSLSLVFVHNIFVADIFWKYQVYLYETNNAYSYYIRFEENEKKKIILWFELWYRNTQCLRKQARGWIQ